MEYGFVGADMTDILMSDIMVEIRALMYEE